MRTTTIVVTALAAALALLTVNASAEKNKAGFVRVTPEEVVWNDRPGYDGVKFATIQEIPCAPP